MKTSLQLAVHSSRIWKNLSYKFAFCFFIVLNGPSLTVKAQDIHFTQFFTTPLILNPAQTGYYDGNYRIGFNFKAQWPWAAPNSTYNYHTESPYIDFSFGERKIKTGWMGIGLHFLNDEAGDGRLTSRRFGLSYAYHQSFDKKHRYVLSAGASLNYVVRSVDYDKFYFNNQWIEDNGFDPSVNSNEPFTHQSFSFFDVSAGLHFGARVSEKVKLGGGFSLLHINRPKNSFYGGNVRLGFRYQANVSADYQISNSFSLSLQAYYGYEKKSSEIMFGSLAGYSFQSRKNVVGDHMLYLGAYYRLKDALAPVLGYQYKSTRILLNYDITLSKLMPTGRANGGPELSIVHIGKWNKEFNGKKVYCPRM
ncbi:MAG: PorP/SprF family type IX secretion system membrane protein [Bacteroidetes bacterium]|nr:PorP/SprF family type IX secretion system membrane protein [Bacteroidota bacterium]